MIVVAEFLRIFVDLDFLFLLYAIAFNCFYLWVECIWLENYFKSSNVVMLIVIDGVAYSCGC